ncbi:MAG: methyltransferase [Phenylobacterium sp.]|uniref:tRNA1(Val) (adenine(37)-N6)-methyltransferase n=1 Tax=Phenylobacterium sp. TaxID=1871053 RepID=UPI0025D7C5CE|nr:methyltransferase [Phenylobacterium sp.]MCA6297563.1 methyltransferase [Phenylobacterium sp.]
MTDPSQSDAILGGRVRLLQSARGYRAGMDAALLAAACDARPGDRVLDLGCGPGAVMLAAAVRRREARFTGVEADPEALALARANIDLNGLSDRMEALSGDVALPFARLGLPRFDAALCNPPFFDDARALRGPAPEKTRAWMAADGLAAWTEFLMKAVRDGGTITIIHRADRLADLLAGLAPRCGSIRIRPVQPRAAAPASRVIVRAVRGGRAPLALLPPLVLHPDGEGKHTPEAEAILRDAAALGWD